MATDISSSTRERAEELVSEAHLVQGSELQLSPVGAGDRFLFDPFEINQQVIDDWRLAHLDTVVMPLFCMSLEPYGGAVRQMAAMNSALHTFHDQLMRISTPGDFDLARASGKIGVVISFHFADCFRELDDVDFFHRLGLRNATIVIRGSNFIGTPHHERYQSGLTQFGQALVERMNQVGVAVDISHANEQTGLDVLEAATKPVFVSHANAFALSPHEKNKSDEIIRKIAAGGGVLAVQPASQLVYPTEPVHLGHFVDLVEHVARVGGPETVAMGFEEPYQGFDQLQKDNAPVESVKFKAGEIDAARLASTPTPEKQRHIPELMTRDRYTVVTAALLDRGFSEEDIRGFLGENIKRTFARIMPGDGEHRPYESWMRAKHTNVGHIADHG